MVGVEGIGGAEWRGVGEMMIITHTGSSLFNPFKAAASAVNAVLAANKSRPKPPTAKQRLGKIMRLGKSWKK